MGRLVAEKRKTKNLEDVVTWISINVGTE